MPPTDPKRDARLAAALRDNLRRRKAQGRDAPAGGQKADESKPASE